MAYGKKNKKVSPEIQVLLKSVLDHFDKEDKSVRERQIRTWKRLKLLWEGFQRTWYSEVAHDWRIWDDQLSDDSSTDQAYYDKPVNIFRAYLESIIAALSVTVPPIICYPDDADNPLDVSTAKAGDKIAALIFKHNNAPLLWLHALFIYCTEGMVACYSYPRADKSYGEYKEEEYEESEEEHEYQICPICEFEMADRVLSNRERDEFQPDDDDVVVDDILFNEDQDICPNCMKMVDPELRRSNLIVTRMVGSTSHPKSRVCMEVYGGLNVKIPNYARVQADIPVLQFSYECHYTKAIEHYEDLHDKIAGSRGKYTSSVDDPYEQWGRLSPQYRGEYPENNVTMRKDWLRPCAFNVLEKEDADKLKKAFPDGAKVCRVNDEFAEACNESLDDCWTITYNPMADYVHYDPAGLLLTSIQEITNDLISLTLQTIEHGIPQTWADPAVVDFKKYGESEAVPGGIYPTKQSMGRPVAEGFHEVKTAQLSGEVLPFATKIQELGQVVSGALPSLFGGQMAGSRTASEYSMSRAQALQRLQNVWKMLTMWWKDIYGKAIPMYIKEVKEDERNVERNQQGNFINVFIRKAELEGRIGNVELEANENLPITWNQRKDVIMEILKLGNPEILEYLGTPENLPLVREAIGLTDFVIPGEDDRQKAYEDINLLVNSMPMPTAEIDPITGEPAEQPSIQVDTDIDNHPIVIDICRSWLISDTGRLAKTENPDGYRNVLLYMKAHKDAMIMQQMQQMQAMAPQMPNGPGPSNGPQITGNEDVTTIQ